jgi:hypothetical protein
MWPGDKVTRGQSDRGQSDRGTKWPGTKWLRGQSNQGTKWPGTKWPGTKWPGDKVTGQSDRDKVTGTKWPWTKWKGTKCKDTVTDISYRVFRRGNIPESRLMYVASFTDTFLHNLFLILLLLLQTCCLSLLRHCLQKQFFPLAVFLFPLAMWQRR